MDIIDKKKFEAAARAALGDAFEAFSEAEAPAACSVRAKEALIESGWRGRWTERLRALAGECSAGASRVCVKPVVVGRPDAAVYLVAVG